MTGMEPELRRRLAGLNTEQRAALLRTLRSRRPGQSPATGGNARREEKRPASLPDTVLPIKPSGHLPALFCVHSISGSAMPYLPLGKYLGHDQPCYGLEAVGLHGGEPHSRADEMLAWHVDAIRRTQPAGPYHLTGWSAGGILAFQIALALQSRGHRVGLLALIDTGPPFTEHTPITDIDALQLFAASFALSLGRQPLELDRQALSGLDLQARLTAVAQAIAEAGMAAPHEVPQVRARARVAVAMIGAAGTARSGRYRGTLNVLVAEQEPRAAQPDGWFSHVEGLVTTHRVPGNHYTMLSVEHIPVIAGTLQSLLLARL